MADINKILEEQRKLTKKLMEDKLSKDEVQFLCGRLIYLVEAMDEHMCQGGESPMEWRNK